MDFDELQAEVSALRDTLANYEISEVFGCALNEMNNVDWKNTKKMNFHSPYRQCNYVVSLALSINASNETKPLGKDEWKDICDQTNKIFNYYSLMHFPNNGDFSSMTKERHDKGSAAMPSFLLSLCAGTHASVEQVKDTVQELYLPFSSELGELIGLSVPEAIEISDFILVTLNARIVNGLGKAMEAWHEFREECDRGLSPEITMENARKRFAEEGIADNIVNMGRVGVDELKSRFSKDKVDAYLYLLCQKRGDTEGDIILPTEELSIDTKPLTMVDDNFFALITGNHLMLGLQNSLYQKLTELDLIEKYNHKKGEFLEERALALFRVIFGEHAQYFSSACEDCNGQNEHDLIILYEGRLLIIECKAKRIRKHFRDIEKSFVRIKDDFKPYIQEGYNQARALEKLVTGQEKTTLYDKRGNILYELEREHIKGIEKIVLTHENEGYLATNLSLLLERDGDDTFPYCLNYYDLVQLSTYKEQLNITAEKFISYLEQRKLVHESVANDDELDIWGFYLHHSGLDEMINAGSDTLFYIPPAYSVMFDEAYRGDTVSQLPALPNIPVKNQKIGRNAPCPCGSGKKYKKCCLGIMRS